jgi:hypothetical protein
MRLHMPSVRRHDEAPRAGGGLRSAQTQYQPTDCEWFHAPHGSP